MIGKTVYYMSAVLLQGLFIASLLSLSIPVHAQGQTGDLQKTWGEQCKPPSEEIGLAPYKKPKNGSDSVGRIIYWNEIMGYANGIDHTPVAPGEDRVYGEQYGPARTSRAFAIVQIAIFDAVNAIDGRYQSYTGFMQAKPCGKASMAAAISQAAHDTLAALYPSQKARFDRHLADDLIQIPEGKAKAAGISIGSLAAQAILALRNDDGSQYPDPLIGVDFFPSDEPGKWRPDPISPDPLAYGAYWGRVEPFVLRSSRQFMAPPPPDLRSFKYTLSYWEVKSIGGDGEITPTKRTWDQTISGIYWSCDGTPYMGTPPRMYNEIAVQIGRQMGTDAVRLARLLALVNTALADAGIASWETKYFYQFWRPTSGIRESDRGTGPTGAGDGNRLTIGDPTFTPLGAQASNTTEPNFTPPFPSYTSGHAAFGSALFQILSRFYGTDNITFTFVSDEFNGITRDNKGNVRPRIPRTFKTLSAAEEDNGQSRIYLGVHWPFDKTEGMALGKRVADYVFDHSFQPLCRRR